jgi:hypothetical protein
MALQLPFKSDGKTTKPAVVQKYGNGKLPDSLLVPCGIGSHRLAEPAARAAKAMVTAAAKDGVALGASDSYRPYAVQEREFKNRYSSTPIAGRKTKVWNGATYWQKPNTAMAATPGTSNHGWGVALDLAQGDGNPADPKSLWLNAKSLNWLAKNGPTFGFWNSVKSEAWHWAYFPGDDIPPAVLEMERTGQVATTATSTPPPDAQIPTGADDQAEFFRTLAFSGEMVITSKGDAVKAIQWALTEAGFPAAIDGNFGSKTEAAVKGFQTAKSLGVDGRVGAKTWSALGLRSRG